MKKLIIKLGFILSLSLIFIASCDTENNVDPRFEKFFIKYYGSQGDQFGADIKQLPDGGFILLGTTDSTPAVEAVGDKEIFLVRTDALGNEVWVEPKTFGRNFDDEGVSIEITPAGEFIIAANSINALGNSDILVLLVNDQGDEIQRAVFGDPNFNDFCTKVTVISTGFMITGYTTNVNVNKNGYNAQTDLEDIFSVRLDNSLNENLLWTKIYGFPGIDRGISLVEKPNGGFLFFGTTNRTSGDIRKSGNTLFSFPADDFGQPSGKIEQYGTLFEETASDVITNSVGGIIMIGSTIDASVSPPSNDIFIVQIRSDNSFEAEGKIGSLQNVIGKSLFQSVDGGYILLGNSNQDIYLGKISNSRQIIWEMTYGGNGNDLAGSVVQLTDGGIVLVGTVNLETQNKMALIKTGPEGKLTP